MKTIADNQQYNYQTKKDKLIREGKPLKDEYAIGFNITGLYSIVRKPNYAAEQAIWISYYIYSIGALHEINGATKYSAFLNWSITGCIMLCLLFQGSGYFTELITLKKYSKYYTKYMEHVPLYIPNIYQIVVSRQQKDWKKGNTTTSKGFEERLKMNK